MGSTHIEISVRDMVDGRFAPGLTVYATLIDAGGHEIGTHQQPYLGHHWLYPYGRNWQVPGTGHYRLCVRIETGEVHGHCQPSHPRHDPVAVEFSDVAIEPD